MTGLLLRDDDAVQLRGGRGTCAGGDEQRAGKNGKGDELLVVLAVLAIIAFGVGFTIHWLFIVAAVLALIWLISLLTGGFGRTGARRW